MSKTLNDLTVQANEFCDSRGWNNNDPNQLISSILIELGELAEHYQWTSSFKKYSEEERKEISYEMVDVLFYLLRLASKSGVDLDKSFAEKLKKLELKYPVGADWKTQHDDYRKSGKSKKYE